MTPTGRHTEPSSCGDFLVRIATFLGFRVDIAIEVEDVVRENGFAVYGLERREWFPDRMDAGLLTVLVMLHGLGIPVTRAIGMSHHLAFDCEFTLLRNACDPIAGEDLDLRAGAGRVRLQFPAGTARFLIALVDEFQARSV